MSIKGKVKLDLTYLLAMNIPEESNKPDELQRQIVRNARTTAVIFGICSIVALISVVFGLVQNVEAERQAELARDKERKVLVCEQETKATRVHVVSLQKELDACRASQK